MIKLLRRAVLLVALCATPSSVAAQLRAVKPEWLHLDIEGSARLGRLIPLEKQTVQSIADVLGSHADPDDNAGFGGEIFSIRRGYGYTSITVRGFAFNHHPAWVRMGLEFGHPEWEDLRDQVLRSWKEGGGPGYTCKKEECYYEWTDEHLLDTYRRAVARQLGALDNASVPESIRQHYDYLMSPFENSPIGPSACGLPLPNEPLMPLEGRAAMDALIEARRVDLITNVLRGYNPGARVYALLALQDLLSKGVKLSPSTLVTMKQVRNLKVPISTCLGCIVNNGLRTDEVVRWWRELDGNR